MNLRKNLRSLGAGVALLALGFSTNAAAVSGQVSRIYVAGNGTVHVRILNDTCTGYWTFKLEDPAGDAWYTLLLAAYHAGTTVHLSTPPCEQQKNQPITSVFQDY